MLGRSRVPIAARTSATSFPALAGRCAGSFARASLKSWSSELGSAGRRSLIRGGGSLAWA